ncbi:MAG: T9SS type A sorting domain-containing protein [Candidatus Cloacimonetes bacterium]|nr:T9SS type A sorting domain-containing protein [Candidatus Cloacimonadota bacterium]
MNSLLHKILLIVFLSIPLFLKSENPISFLNNSQKYLENAKSEQDFSEGKFYPGSLYLALNYNSTKLLSYEIQTFENNEWITTGTMNVSYENNRISLILYELELADVNRSTMIQRYEIQWTDDYISQIDVSYTMNENDIYFFREFYTFEEGFLQSYYTETTADLVESERGEYIVQEGKITNALIEVFSDGSWQNSIHYYAEYSNGRLSAFNSDNWISGNWEHSYREEYTFTDDIISEILTQQWSSSVWNNYSLSLTEIESGLSVLNTVYLWNEDEWEENIRQILTYDDNQTLSEVITQRWDQNNTDWYTSERILFNFDVSATNELTYTEQNTIKAYPNPFNPNLSLEIACEKNSELSVDLFNIKGEKIISLFNGISDHNTIIINWNSEYSLDHPLASGVYFVRAKQKNSVSYKKVLLLK